jgi:hypothetical protein
MTNTKNTNVVIDKVALYASNPLFDTTLGRLNHGYNIVTQEQAEAWKKITDKVREATPLEVAASFEV